MIKPMTDEEAKRAIERAKANRFDEAGNYGENNGTLGETTKMTKMNLLEEYSDFVEDMILTYGRDRLAENTLGLVGEAGEVAEKVKKFFRDNTLDEVVLRKELGDVMFYLVALHNAFGFNIEDTIKDNMEKLISRKQRGTLRGSGDNR